jgi:hypothetical protein
MMLVLDTWNKTSIGERVWPYSENKVWHKITKASGGTIYPHSLRFSRAKSMTIQKHSKVKNKEGEKMESKWRPVQTEVDTVSYRGDSIHLSNVKALQHSETGQIVMSPQDLSQAEIEVIAKKYGLKNARDVAIFLILFATPSEGIIKGGDMLNKYHLQKSLFYLWKGLEDEGLYEIMPRDEFVGAENGLLPINLDDDLTNFEKQKLIAVTKKKYLEYPKPLKYIRLTEEGARIAKEL